VKFPFSKAARSCGSNSSRICRIDVMTIAGLGQREQLRGRFTG
jgi:hypothetical protein